MTNLVTLLTTPLIALGLLAIAPAQAHAQRDTQRQGNTTVFVGGAGERDLAQALRARIYPQLRGNMRPVPHPRKADIRVRVKEVAFEPVFLPVKRKVKGHRVKVKERLRVRYAYQVTIFNQGRPIDRFWVKDLAAEKLVYRKTHSAYQASYQSGYRGHGKGPHNGMAFARNRALTRVEMKALNHVARKVNRKLVRLNLAQNYEPRRRYNRNAPPDYAMR